MIKPLTRWRCDVCSEWIKDQLRAYVVWHADADSRCSKFRVIHQINCDHGGYNCSAPLEDFLGPRGLSILLGKFSAGPILLNAGAKPRHRVEDIDGYVDLIRRLQVPFYEESRPAFQHREVIEDYSDGNEVAAYLPETLEQIAQRFSA